MLNKLYGRAKDQESLKSILDDVQEDLRKVSPLLSTEDRKLVEEHASFVREMELDLRRARRRRWVMPFRSWNPA